MGVLLKVHNKIVSVVLLLLILYFNVYLISVVYDINETTHKYNYISHKRTKNLGLEEKCEIFECNAIRRNGVIHYFDKNIFLYNTQINTNNINIYDKYFVDIEEFSLNIKTKNGYVYIDLINDVDKMITIILFSIPMFIIIFGFAVVSTITEERKESIIKTAGNEAILTNKSMIMIAENIHHELKTPLEVIANKVDKIKRRINKYIESNGKSDTDSLFDLDEAFDYINASSQQILNTLNEMKEYKEMKHSKKDENVYEMLNKASKMVALSSPNYEYNIDNYFKSVNLDGALLSTSDLLNIIINHIKNSLQAEATKVYMVHEKTTNNFCYIRIIDNGNGIPERAQEKIFEANFSTKDNSDGIRGNGMYLNKQILLSADGDVRLISSSNKGTTIGLKFKTKRIKETKGVKNA